jgi:diguanylate cyclase (GGDEF)-like protein
LKPINDLHGHHAGDKAIKMVADLLSNHFRKSDIVARMGGDEFTVLVIDPDENVESMNRRLQSHFNAFNLASNLPYQINISFGSIVSELNPTTKLETLINQADKLMYMEKSRKKH